MVQFNRLLEQSSFSPDDLAVMLDSEGEQKNLLFRKAAETKELYLGKKIYFRGLIEFSNFCYKDCYYCGIRKSNLYIHRFTIPDKEIIEACRFAYENRFGSVVLQSGENSSLAFAKRIEHLLVKIKSLSNGELGVTLSLGEQKPDVYRRWFEAGAHRYLLRIETTNEDLYRRIHPDNPFHDYKKRVDCLYSLKKTGYQTGTGVMIGLPFQTKRDLAADLIFFRDFDVDMVGMGPYIVHKDTPLYIYRDQLLLPEKRLDLALKMIAVLRIMMKDINIAASTALEAIDSHGREKGIKAGANIVMPNITPGLYRNDYALYENKPCGNDQPPFCRICIDENNQIGYGEWGDSKHFFERTRNIQ